MAIDPQPDKLNARLRKLRATTRRKLPARTDGVLAERIKLTDAAPMKPPMQPESARHFR